MWKWVCTPCPSAQEEWQAPRTQPGLGTERCEFKVKPLGYPKRGP